MDVLQPLSFRKPSDDLFLHESHDNHQTNKDGSIKMKLLSLFDGKCKKGLMMSVMSVATQETGKVVFGEKSRNSFKILFERDEIRNACWAGVKTSFFTSLETQEMEEIGSSAEKYERNRRRGRRKDRRMHFSATEFSFSRGISPSIKNSARFCAAQFRFSRLRRGSRQFPPKIYTVEVKLRNV